MQINIFAWTELFQAHSFTNVLVCMDSRSYAIMDASELEYTLMQYVTVCCSIAACGNVSQCVAAFSTC